MKRPFLVGCLVVVLGVVVVGGVLAYTYLVRPAMGAVGAARDLARIEQIENRVRDKSTFRAPSDGELTEAQVERYVAAARQIVDDLEGQVNELDARYQQIEAQDRNPGLRELASAYGDILRLIVDAKEAQVEALNAHGFSLAEYAWVRNQVIRAAGFSAYQVDLAALAEPGGDDALREIQADVPEANVALVTPYVEEMERFLPLAAFGL
ncbi:MAG: hypothetical protein R6W77_05230 [Trueperaceae bacterium]